MKKLFIISCVIIVTVVLPILFFDNFLKNGFLKLFFETQMIPLLGTILALNLALGASLQAILFNIEVQHDKVLFVNARREIKENMLFMIIVFIILFVVQVATPLVTIENKYLLANITGIKLLLFFLYLYAVKEIGESIFHITHKNIKS